MLKAKGVLVVLLLLAAAVAGTGRARLELDEITAPMRETFVDMIYLPRGRTLRLAALGFETPLADALFVDGLTFYARSMETVDKSWIDGIRKYTYALFDVITDLSPRFMRAYKTGVTFLTSTDSPEMTRNGIRLAEKAVAAAEKEARDGSPIEPDPRWLFHTLAASAYDQNIQSICLRAGDRQGAAEARRQAGIQYELAAKLPDAPEFVRLAAAGYASRLARQTSLEASMVSAIGVWQMLYEDAQSRGDEGMLADMARRLTAAVRQLEAIRHTRALEAALGRAAAEYMRANASAPTDVQQLADAGLIPGVPPCPLANDEMDDRWLVLPPDASVRSAALADMDAAFMERTLYDAVLEYLRSTDKRPEEPQELVKAGILPGLPRPPLAPLGQQWIMKNGLPQLCVPLVWKDLP